MSEAKFPMKKMIPVVVITWVLSLVTTLAVVYFAPSMFPPLSAETIADEAIITTKLADGSVSSSKILDGTITAQDLADGSVIAVKVADDAVTTAKIADGTITEDDLSNSAIVTVKLADEAVTSSKILDGTITAADLADGSIISVKIVDGAVTTRKIADYAVTNLKLAPFAIPFNSTYSTTVISTTQTGNWVNMTDMSVNLTLSRTSHLLIMFSATAQNNDPNNRVVMRALVNNLVAFPGAVFLTPTLTVSELNQHAIGWASHAFNFYRPSVSAGTYTIKMQWIVTVGTGDIGYRTLTVIVLPA